MGIEASLPSSTGLECVDCGKSTTGQTGTKWFIARVDEFRFREEGLLGFPSGGSLQVQGWKYGRAEHIETRLCPDCVSILASEAKGIRSSVWKWLPWLIAAAIGSGVTAWMTGMIAVWGVTAALAIAVVGLLGRLAGSSLKEQEAHEKGARRQAMEILEVREVAHAVDLDTIPTKPGTGFISLASTADKWPADDEYWSLIRALENWGSGWNAMELEKAMDKIHGQRLGEFLNQAD